MVPRLPDIPSSCFKITSSEGYTDANSGDTYVSASNFENACRMDGTSLAVPKSLAEGVAMQNFVGNQFDVMIGVKKSDVFEGTDYNSTEIILVADEYGNQESNDTAEDDATAANPALRCRFLKKSANGDGKGWHGSLPIWISARHESRRSRQLHRFRVTLVVKYLVLVDLDMESSIFLLAQQPRELPKSKLSQSRYLTTSHPVKETVDSQTE